MIPFLLISLFCASSSSIHNTRESKEEEKNLTLIDIAVFTKIKKGDFSKTNFSSKETAEWLKPCQAEIEELRKSSAFTPDTSESEEKQYQVADARDRASAFYLTWCMNKEKSPIPAGQEKDWNAYEACFEETSLKTYKDVETYSIDKDDKCWKKIEDLYGISISATTKSDVSLIYEQIHYSPYYQEYVAVTGVGTVGELYLPEKYPEGSAFEGGSDKAVTLWNQVKTESRGNFSLSPYYPQCVDFAHWRFWTMYKQDWSGAGNGKECAGNIVATFPDASRATKEGYYFTLSNQPSGGAVFSVGPTSSNPWGHVGFVEKVEDGYVWFSDGNVSLGGYVEGQGIRVNNKMKVDRFLNGEPCYGACTFAAPNKADKGSER